MSVLVNDAGERMSPCFACKIESQELTKIVHRAPMRVEALTRRALDRMFGRSIGTELDAELLNFGSTVLDSLSSRHTIRSVLKIQKPQILSDFLWILQSIP